MSFVSTSEIWPHLGTCGRRAKDLATSGLICTGNFHPARSGLHYFADGCPTLRSSRRGTSFLRPIENRASYMRWILRSRIWVCVETMGRSCVWLFAQFARGQHQRSPLGIVAYIDQPSTPGEYKRAFSHSDGSRGFHRYLCHVI